MADVGALARVFLEGTVLLLEVATAAIILHAAVRALLHLTFLKSGHARHPVRQDFGRALLLALDFAIGGDVVRVALTPTLTGAATAGLVILARVILTFVLEHELKQDKDRPEGAPSSGGGRA